ncbi:MAG: phosphodiesterase [Anaerolineae bacterium]
MMGTPKTLLVLALALPLWGNVASADVLLIDEVRQSERMQLPDNGLSKAEVEARFGTPETRHQPVGDPPITRWDYDRYSVYFEYDLVLFSVLAPGEVIDGA